VAEWAVELQPFEIAFKTTKVIKSKALAEFTAEWTDPFADESPKVESSLLEKRPRVSGSCTSTVLLWFRQQICHRGRCMAVCGKGVNTTERSGTVVARVYLASDPATVARPYVLL
jgi:hypothetical protein